MDNTHSIRELSQEEIAQVSGGASVGVSVDALGMPIVGVGVSTTGIVTPTLSLVGTAVGGVLGKL
ncbi:Blp family class II bacteriocin [Acidiferrobacter thiooxydans]|jgi:hypothetical protein|uniref:Uncharacterized protein n=1 Tax=Acidiferrobacter thiooxydans TaxID=163359 RepID=A0A1C2FXS0_9GAMM|nr:Blp family class II bacteriocin [Acidiferrobacter thiooxydans]RCN59366.1 hypothetical protein C4900_06620 [Acidiferrobacter thiooxydans]UEO01140.1 Blp family class II bacteriocin [Acidiferrobacter thiooxydans]